MAQIHVEATREIATPAARVFACIADYKERPRWLPAAYSNLSIESGGTGAGTVATYKLKVGPRERRYRVQVSEPTAGSVLKETDSGSSLASTWTVSARGAGSYVSLVTTWNGAGGIGGFFERMFAPRGLRKVYDEQLARLAQYLAAEK